MGRQKKSFRKITSCCTVTHTLSMVFQSNHTHMLSWVGKKILQLFLINTLSLDNARAVQ